MEKFRDAKLIDIAQIFIGISVVVLGIFGAWIYSGQLEQMKTTNRLTQEALDINSRPWVGIENPANMPITFSYYWAPPLPWPTIEVSLNFIIKNYGSSTARVMTPAFYVDHWPGNKEPPTLIRQSCQIDKYRTPGQVTIQGDVGEIILPSAITPYAGGPFAGFGANTPKDFIELAFTVCILYEDGGGKWHYSGYRYRALHSPTTPVPGHPGWSYSNFSRAFLESSDAE